MKKKIAHKAANSADSSSLMRKRFLGDGKDGIMKLSVIRRKEIVIKKKGKYV